LTKTFNAFEVLHILLDCWYFIFNK